MQSTYNSVDPRERSSMISLVNQQKKDARFREQQKKDVRKGPQRSAAPFGTYKPSAAQQAVVVTIEEADVTDTFSDTPTEVEAYNMGNGRSCQATRSQRNAQRAILEIVRNEKMGRDEIVNVIEILSSLHSSIKMSPQQRGGQQVYQQTSNKFGNGRSKSGPDEEDIEIIHHNHANETYYVIPPVSDHPQPPRPLSTPPSRVPENTPLLFNSPYSVDHNAASEEQSPLPGDYCPALHRETHGQDGDENAPTAIPKAQNPPFNNLSHLSCRSFNDSIQSPRSAFDDCSVGSSNSAFTESSRRNTLNRSSGLLTSG